MRDTVTESQVVLGIAAACGVTPSPNVVAEICRLANKHRSRMVFVTPRGQLAIVEVDTTAAESRSWQPLIGSNGLVCIPPTSVASSCIRAANDQYGLDWLLDPQ